MPYHHDLRSYRAIANQELRPTATYLLADAWIHRCDAGYQRAIQVNQTGRPADLCLRGDLFRRAARGPTGKAEVRHHQYVALPLRRQSVGPHRLHERRLTASRRQPAPHAPSLEKISNTTTDGR